MQRQIPALVAALVAVAACTPQQTPAAPAEYVPSGRVPAAVPQDQALRECRQQLEGAGRQAPPAEGPRALRQIPPPLSTARPAYPTIEACMEAKGYRRAAP